MLQYFVLKRRSSRGKETCDWWWWWWWWWYLLSI